MTSGFEEGWRRRFIDRGRRFDDDAAIAGWTSAGLAARLRNFQRVWPGDRAQALWLDAGCGAGSYTRYLAERGVIPFGLDYSLPSVQKARERSPAGIAWMVGNVKQLPLQRGRLDGALCFGVLQALEQPDEAVAELMSVVKPGGQVWVDVLNSQCLPTLLQGLRAKRSGRPLPLRYHSADRMKELLRSCGADEVRVYWIPILPSRLARLQRWIESRWLRGLLRWIGPLASPFSHAVLLSARRRAVPALGAPTEHRES
jgi:2-polyprenyl-3-methyl-5-hydroxy-6-metoxy-1,4-benzoquinol methylase